MVTAPEPDATQINLKVRQNFGRVPERGCLAFWQGFSDDQLGPSPFQKPPVPASHTVRRVSEQLLRAAVCVCCHPAPCLQLSMAVYWAVTNKKVFCRVTLEATNVYGTPIPNVSFQGQYTLDPDNTCTDSTNAWPQTISGTFTSSGTADSPAFPYRARCDRTYKGARCVFNITSISAPNYKCEAAACISNFGPVASGLY